MTTTENNKLIAEFMGYQVVDNPRIINGENFFQYIDKENKKYTYVKSLLRYNDSWDWLMPVVEKIEGMNIDIGGITTSPEVIIVYGDCTIQDEHDKKLFNFYHHSIDSNDKLGATYNAVVEFINYYNQNK